MRTRIIILALALLAALPTFAQSGQGGSNVLGSLGAPTGTCGALQLDVDTTSGNLYTCNVGTWQLVAGGGGSGTVTSVSSGNLASLFTVSVATPTTTPAFSFAFATGQTAHEVIGTCGTATTVSLCALVPGDLPTAIPIANIGTAGLSGAGPITINAAGAINCSTCNTSSASVTSVALTVPSWLTVGGSPITSSGTFAVTPTAAQTSHQVIGTCGSATTFTPCTLVAGDIPTAIPIANIGSAGLSGSGGVSIASTGAISLSAIPIGSVGSAGLSGSGGVSIASTGAISLSAIPLTALATQAADTFLINATGSSASPTAVAAPSTGTNGCAGTTDALIYNTTTHALACHQISGGGGTALSGITVATGANTIANGNNGAQVWNWAQTTNSQTAFTFGETTAATGTSDQEVAITTLAGSTASPLTLTNSLTGSQATQCTLCVFPTWNTSGIVDAGIFENVTNTASGTGSLLMDLQIGGASFFQVNKSGNINIGNTNGSIKAGNGALTILSTGSNTSVTIQGLGTSGVVLGPSGNTGVPVTIKGTASQSGDLLDINSSGSTIATGFNSTGAISKYNGVATVNNGVPSEIAKLALTAQSAAITATNLIASLPSTDTYKLHFVLKVTTPGTSSVLGGTTGIVIGYTDGGDSVVQSYTMACSSQAGLIITVSTGNTGNSTTTVSSCDLYFFGKTGTAVTYAIGYSSTGTTMVYEANATLLAD